MNYGCASLNADEPPLVLHPDDERDRYAVQLYHRVASAADLRGREVLEVGCGRGGGSSFVHRYHRPKKTVGVDFSPKAVRFCQRQHELEGLSFVRGDAEALPFGDGSFDAVVNVESSHCYGSMRAFLGEVERVLRHGGHFLFADFRPAEGVSRLEEQLSATGMKIVEKEDVTINVLEALRLDSARKLALIERSVDGRLVGLFRQFAAVEGSEVFDGFQHGAAAYLRYALRAGGPRRLAECPSFAP